MSIRLVAFPTHLTSPTRNRTSTTLERLATGLRINRAADDAAGLGVAVNLEADARGAAIAYRGMSRALQILDVAEGTLREQIDRLQRMRELAVEAASGTLADEERQYLQDEVQELRLEISRAAAVEAGPGQKVLDGSYSSSGLGAKSVAMDGSARTFIEIDLDAADAASLGLGGTSATLDAGSAGLTGLAIDGLLVSPGTITISSVDIAATGADITGTSPADSQLATGGTLDLTVNSRRVDIALDGDEAAVLTSGAAPTSPLAVGGTLDLTVDGVSVSVDVDGSTAATLTGGIATTPLTSDATLAVSVDGTTRSISIEGVSAATITGSGVMDLPLAVGGDLHLSVNGSAVTVALHGGESAVLTGSASVTGLIATAGTLAVDIDGTTYTVAVDGSTSGTTAGSASPTGPLAATGTLAFAVDGTAYSVSVDGSMPPTVAGTAYSGQLTQPGTLSVTVNGTTANVTVAAATSASLTGASAAATYFDNSGTLSVTVDGVTATRTVTGSTAATTSGTFGNNGRINGSGGTLELSIDGVAYSIALAVNDPGATVVSKINAAIGGAGTASYDGATKTLTLTTTNLGSDAKIEVLGTTGGLPIGELGLTIGSVDVGTDGDRVVDVLADLEASLGGVGQFSLVGGVATLTSGTEGASSTVSIGGTAAVVAELGLTTGDADTGSDGDTVADVAAALSAALGGAALVSAAGDVLSLTATTAGASSVITISGTSTAGLLGQLGLSTGTTAGSDGDTLDDIVAEMNAALGSAGTAENDGGVLRLTSNSLGTSSTAAFLAGSTATVLTAFGLTAGQTGTGSNGDTLADVASALQAAIGSAGTVSTLGGFLSIESASVGSTAAVSMGAGSTAALLSELGFTSSSSATGTDGDDLTTVLAALNTALAGDAIASSSGGRLVLTSTLDGSTSEVTVLGSSTAGVLSGLGLSAGQTDTGTDGDTLAEIAAKLNTALGSRGSAAAVGGALEITSASVGASSTIQIAASTSAAALAALGFSSGQSTTGTDGDSLAAVASNVNAQLGAAGTATVSGGRLVITSTNLGADAEISIDSTSTAALLSSFGWTSADTAQGTDGDTLAEALTKINDAISGVGTASLDGSGAIVITSDVVGAAARVQVNSGSTAAVLAALGLTSGQSDSGTAAMLRVTGTHTDGTTATVDVLTTTNTITFTGDLAGLRLGKDPTATTASGVYGSVTITSADEISVSTEERAQLALDVIDIALHKLSGQLSYVGATQVRLMAGQEQVLQTSLTAEAARSTIADADYVELSRDLLLEQIRQNSGIQALSVLHRIKKDTISTLLG